MTPSRLSERLMRDGIIDAAVLRTAVARQAVYGGGLDTALLELEALDESTLWGALSAASGVPPPAAALLETPDPDAAARFDAGWSRRCRAVPVGQRDGNLQLLCSDPIDESVLGEACTALGVSAEIYVVPEVRLAAARQVVYGDPVPPRLLRLLARLLGATAVRRWMIEQAPPAQAAELSPAVPPNGNLAAVAEAVAASAASGDDGAAALDFEVSSPSLAAPFPASPTPVGRAPTAGPEQAGAVPGAQDGGAAGPLPTEEELCKAALDANPDVRTPALHALRPRLSHPRVRALTEKLRRELAGSPEAATAAARSLGELRDPDAVPTLVGALQKPAPLGEAAHKALVEIARQDFGNSRRRWSAWWDRHHGQERMEWLFESLGHKVADLRFAASEELRLLTGEYFGYHFDLPKREREEARERWRAWWRDGGRVRPAAG